MRSASMPPGGVPSAFLEPVSDALRIARARATRAGAGHSRSRALAGPLRPRAGGRRGRAGGARARGNARPRRAATRRKRPRVVRRRGAAPHPPRLGRAPAPRGRGGRAARAGALRAQLARRRRAGGRGGVERLREVLFPLQRLPLAPEVWERQVLPVRMPEYRPGAARPALHQRRGRVAGRRRRASGCRVPRGRRAARPAAGTRRRRPQTPAPRPCGRPCGRAPPGRARRRDQASPRPRSSKRCGGSRRPARRPTTPGSRCADRAVHPRRVSSRREPGREG